MNGWLAEIPVVFGPGARPIAGPVCDCVALDVLTAGAGEPNPSDGSSSWHWPGGLHLHDGSDGDQ